MNYSDLTTAIKDYVQNDETTFTDHLNDFIIAAEDQVFFYVQMPATWKSTTSLETAASTSEYTVSGMLDVFDVRVSETASDTDGPYRYLLRKDYDFLDEAFPGSASAVDTGVPKYYAVSSADSDSTNPRMTIRMGPTPNGVYPFVIDYYGKKVADSITSGSVGANETWLSVTAPDVLLYGSLVQAYTFMKGEPDLIQNYEKQFQEGINRLKILTEGRGTSDVYRTGQKRVQVQ